MLPIGENPRPRALLPSGLPGSGTGKRPPWRGTAPRPSESIIRRSALSKRGIPGQLLQYVSARVNGFEPLSRIDAASVENDEPELSGAGWPLGEPAGCALPLSRHLPLFKYDWRFGPHAFKSCNSRRLFDASQSDCLRYADRGNTTISLEYCYNILRLCNILHL